MESCCEIRFQLCSTRKGLSCRPPRHTCDSDYRVRVEGKERRSSLIISYYESFISKKSSDTRAYYSGQDLTLEGQVLYFGSGVNRTIFVHEAKNFGSCFS